MGKTRDVKEFRSGPPPDEWSSRFYHDKIIFDPKDDLVVSEGAKFDLFDSLKVKKLETLHLRIVQNVAS